MEIFKSNFNIADFTDIVDVRDGLNPALRALFFALKTMPPDDRFTKSSRLLKDIMGISEDDFESIYDLLVNTTWPRVDLPLVDGHGNFGFPPAYPDFSEIKLTEFAKDIVGRADENDFKLPFAVPIPYVLACGTLGYSQSETKIPTHNLAEVIDAMVALIKNPELETKDLLQFIKGPDLLIGGVIENPEELCGIYENGFGNIKVLVTMQTFNSNCVSDYCDWYQLKMRKVYKKEAFRVEIPYYAFLNDGKRCELMSLKKILKKHLDYFRVYKSELDDNELCDALLSFKDQSSCRRTYCDTSVFGGESMGKEKNKKNLLCEDEQFILDVLLYLGAEGADALGPLLLLNQDKAKKAENAKKLRKYIELKGKYITQQDILEKSVQITTTREQYYPFEMYVKYIGDTIEQLSHNKVYHVEMVFGDDEYYLIECDYGILREFDAELFEIQKVTEFIYIGYENKDGTTRISDGFIIGRRYIVESFEMGKYICRNGMECEVYEIEPVEFRAKEPTLPVPFERVDDALKMVSRAFEFGSIRQLSIHLHPDCEYISQSGKKEFHKKGEIVKHLQNIASTQLENDIFIDCALATITESEKTNRFSVNDRCIAIYEEKGCEDVVFVTISDDNRYITGIYVLNEIYKFKLDED